MAAGLLELTTGPDWSGRGIDAVVRLRRARPDLPTLLTVTGAALDDDPIRAGAGIGRVAGQLADSSWTGAVATRLAGHRTIGVLSLGSETLMTLEAAAFTDVPHHLFAHRLAVLQGLGYLPFCAVPAPPDEAGALLLPGVAADDTTLWTYVGWADIAMRARLKGCTVVAVVHPAAYLSPADRAAYRPPASVVRTDLP